MCPQGGEGPEPEGLSPRPHMSQCLSSQLLPHNTASPDCRVAFPVWYKSIIMSHTLKNRSVTCPEVPAIKCKAGTRNSGSLAASGIQGQRKKFPGTWGGAVLCREVLGGIWEAACSPGSRARLGQS